MFRLILNYLGFIKCMGGANHYQHSSTKRFNVCGQVPSSDRNLCKHQVTCVLIIELREFNNKWKNDKMQHNFGPNLSIITWYTGYI